MKVTLWAGPLDGVEVEVKYPNHEYRTADPNPPRRAVALGAKPMPIPAVLYRLQDNGRWEYQGIDGVV